MTCMKDLFARTRAGDLPKLRSELGSIYCRLFGLLLLQGVNPTRSSERVMHGYVTLISP